MIHNNRRAVLACPECDLLHRHTPLPLGAVARCRRCTAVLYRNTSDSHDRTVAYALTAAILFVVANIFPIVTIEAQGHHTATTLLGTVFALYEQNMMTVGGLVFITTILVPALEIGVMLYVLLSLKAGGKGTQRAMPVSLRLGQTVRPWGMLEVFVLGTIVSLVKLAHLATVVPGIGLWSLGAMMICLAAMAASFDSHSLWEAIGGSYDS